MNRFTQECVAGASGRSDARTSRHQDAPRPHRTPRVLVSALLLGCLLPAGCDDSARSASGSPDPATTTLTATDTPASPAPKPLDPAAHSPALALRLEIPERGRLRVPLAHLPRDRRVAIALELHEEGAPAGDTRAGRIVGSDGRREDVVLARDPKRPDQFGFEIPTAFLRPGLYLIEIETEEPRALNLRRYVLDVAE